MYLTFPENWLLVFFTNFGYNRVIFGYKFSEQKFKPSII